MKTLSETARQLEGRSTSPCDFDDGWIPLQLTTKKAGRKMPINPIGYKCINVLVQRAIAKVVRYHNMRKRSRKWNDNNRNRIRRTTADLYNKKKKARVAQQVEYNRKRKQQNDDVYVEQKLRGHLKYAVDASNVEKAASTMKVVGCSRKSFREHLQNQLPAGASLRDYDTDHIFPIKRYNLKIPDQQRRCFHWSNLQPLLPTENKRKSAKLPTIEMARKVHRWAWPDGVTEDMLSSELPQRETY